MSGTSVDSVDSVVVDFIENNVKIINKKSYPIKYDLKNRIFSSVYKESIKQKEEKNGDFNKEISIEIRENNNHIFVTIIDNGVGFGIFENNIKDILHPYFTTKKNGSGLGLSIVNKIINDHNGKIEFNSINDGAKVTITFNLNES